MSSLDVVDEVIEKTLASIPRSDQRRWGDMYVRGLLAAEGKKTVRSLANWAGRSFEQNLHQFISKSPWDSGSVRMALAHHMHRAALPRAWVVQPLVLTKMGRHSVGVDRQFVAEFGRVVNCQQGVGVWLANEQVSCPVDWRISLPAGWIEEPDLRQRAAIPEFACSDTLEQCAVKAVVRMAVEWDLPRRPVVMDLREGDPRLTCQILTDHQIPFVVRVDDPERLVAASSRGLRSDHGYGAHHADPATTLISMVRQQRRPVEWRNHGADTIHRTAVGSVAVRPLSRRSQTSRSHEEDLVLLGAWANPADRRPHEFWLSNLPRLPLGTLYRTAMLSRRVERDLAEVSDPLGVRDFEGRSYPGWHHHMTMVSLAHAITVLCGSAQASAA
ncbi:IS701 family transposase [Streptacidiphilus fuscans]|uniref:Transposase n=1 Tax=Streptacidiphilus fuscans TaxID=2789292 RepID=A0A931B5X6_9ACTN|nr:transposase [Streptacidiphilus fuscans]MBF9070781.1 transposase [Streptacidiphilus fuscans]